MRQLTLPININNESQPQRNYYENLILTLSGDLSFKENGNNVHPSHKTHSFPAKFPPQLPRKFIRELTIEGDVILDPMMGSGTTLLEAHLYGRRAIGFDIDPLAILLSQVKVLPFDIATIKSTGYRILDGAKKAYRFDLSILVAQKEKRFDTNTSKFIDYWFAPETQLELLALISEIEKIDDQNIRDYFKLVFSSIIITKMGGVSLALDLAHTRPHKAKLVITKKGQVVVGDENSPEPRNSFLRKTLRSPIDEFEKKYFQNIKNIVDTPQYDFSPAINYGNAQSLPLAANSIDLIVTSPPYASNAIDYMRAHKFTLIWFGYSIDTLTEKRKTYIGGEGFVKLPFSEFPKKVTQVVENISLVSKAKGQALNRYYSEMTLVLLEMYRVLKPGKASIVVVGNSTLAGQDAEIQDCLVDIGTSIGFDVPKVGIRLLDRNKRMLPTGADVNRSSQIQQRMHEEYVIGFYKPLT